MARAGTCLLAIALFGPLVAACGADTTGPAKSVVFQTGGDESNESDTPSGGSTPADPAPAAPSAAPDPGPTPVTAQAILAKLAGCTKVSSAPYAKDSGGTANIDVCSYGDVVYVKADMDIDCDGKSSSVCSKSTDPWFLASTAATDSLGKPLDAATLPYVVVPGVSSRWSYKASGIALGSVVAVIYDDKIEYGIVGDIGPASVIGEASYAMAKSLGIDPNPKTGGVASGVTYVFFPNTSVPKNEDHAAAVSVGEASARAFLDAPATN